MDALTAAKLRRDQAKLMHNIEQSFNSLANEVMAPLADVAFGAVAENQTAPKGVITMDMLREAKKAIGAHPVQREIKCGDLAIFKAAIEKQTGPSILAENKNVAYFCGIEVRVSPLVPVDKAILFENGKAVSIIDLND